MRNYFKIWSLVILMTNILASISSVNVCAAAEQQTFRLVTDISELGDGDQFIVVSTDKNTAMCGLNGKVFSSCSVTLDGDYITTQDDVLLLALEKDGEHSYLRTSDGLYVSNMSTSSTTNYVALEATKSERARVTVTKNPDNFVVLFSKDIEKVLVYNPGGNIFSCYPTDQKNSFTRRIQLYKYVGNLTMTSIKFTDSSVVVYRGQESAFVSPVASVVASDGTEIDGATLRYSSSNEDVAEVDGYGNVTLHTPGTTLVSAKFLGDDSYASSSASYELRYLKNESSVTFGEGMDNSTFVVNVGEEGKFSAPKATLTPSGIGEVAYRSSDTGVAEVGTDGEITFGNKIGTTEITAYFEENDDYSGSSASYVIRRKSDNIVFSTEYKSFDAIDKEEITIEKSFPFVTDNGEEYVFKVNECAKSRNSNGVLKFFSGKGMVKSPVIDAPNGYKLTVYLYMSSASAGALYLKSGSLSTKKAQRVEGVEPSKSEGVGYAVSLDVPDASAFTLSCVKECQVSRIVIELNKVEELNLDDKMDNDAVIAAQKGNRVNVKIDRHFYGDGWNTICLPFSVDEITLKEKFGQGVMLRKFSKVDAVKTTMYFDVASTISAGEPYLIKPDEDLDGVYFRGVLMESDSPERKGEDGFYMQGVYGPTYLSEDGTNLFLGEGNKFYKPAMGKNNLRGFRVYLIIPRGFVNQSISYDTDGGTDGVLSMEDASFHDANTKVYGIDGHYVGRMTQKLGNGIYIVNGKAVVVKNR